MAEQQWKIVPVPAVGEMIDAALAIDGQWSINAIPRLQTAWRAMCAAAPEPPPEAFAQAGARVWHEAAGHVEELDTKLHIIIPKAIAQARLEAHNEAVEACAQIAEGPIYKEHYRGTAESNWSAGTSPYGSGRMDAAAACRALKRAPP